MATHYGIESRHVWMAAVVQGLVSLGIAQARDLDTSSPDEARIQWMACAGFPKGCEAALVWGDWEKGVNGWYVRAPKGYTFPLHSHTAPERIVMLRGRMLGGEPDAGDTLLTPGMYWGAGGKAPHWARCEDACLMYITYDAGFDVKFH